MSGSVVKALEQSPLLQSYGKDPLDLSYGIQRSYPNLVPGKSYAVPTTYPANTQDVFGKKMNISITREGYWSGAILEVFGKHTNAVGYTNNPSIGLELFSSITLTCANRVIWTQSDSYAGARTQASPVEKSAFYYRNSKFLSVEPINYAEPLTNLIAGTRSFVTYVPIYIPFFEDPRNYINLKNVEPMVLNFTFAEKASMGMPATDTIKAASDILGSDGYVAKLHLVTVNYERQTEDALTAANNAATKELQYLSYTSESLIYPVTPNNTKSVVEGLYPIRVNIASSSPATNTYVKVRKTEGATNGSDIGRCVPIVKYSLKANSSPYMTDIPKVVQAYTADTRGGGGLTISAAGALDNSARDKCLTLPWNEEINNRVQLCGALPFVGLANPELTLYVGVNPNDGAHEVVIVNESATNLTMFGNNGVIEISSSE